MQLDPRAVATVVVTWTEPAPDGRRRTAVVRLSAEGGSPDRFVDALLDGLDASTDPVYTVEIGEVEERTTRAKRPRRPRPPPPIPVQPAPTPPDPVQPTPER